MREDEPPVRAGVRAGAVGVIELNRPRALNALDPEMVRLMTDALRRWRDDPAVRSVVVRSTSPKAFCAGGDIRAVRTAGLAGDDAAVRGYFTAEYALNALIARYPKPYTALIDGYAMGGGLGISVHGSARVVTERASMAMPETAIGFFPDIGASYFLPRLPGAAGWYLGLTGARITGEQAVAYGLATHYVPAAELPVLEAALTGAGGGSPDAGPAAGSGEGPAAGPDGAPGAGPDVEPGGVTDVEPAAVPDVEPAAVLNRFTTPAGAIRHREAVDRCFGAPDLAAVRARLAAEDGDRQWADDALAALDAASPASLATTFELLRAGAGSTLEECLARELELACRTARTPDFHEGVRAALVDKDRKPSWSTPR